MIQEREGRSVEGCARQHQIHRLVAGAAPSSQDPDHGGNPGRGDLVAPKLEKQCRRLAPPFLPPVFGPVLNGCQEWGLDSMDVKLLKRYTRTRSLPRGLPSTMLCCHHRLLSSRFHVSLVVVSIVQRFFDLPCSGDSAMQAAYASVRGGISVVSPVAPMFVLGHGAYAIVTATPYSLKYAEIEAYKTLLKMFDQLKS